MGLIRPVAVSSISPTAGFSAVGEFVLLRFLHFKRLGECGVTENEFCLGIALGFIDFRLAIIAAESDLCATDFGMGVWIQFSAGKRALGLSRLTSGDELLIGFRRILGGVLGERARTVATAEIDLAVFVIGGLVFQSWLARDWASRLEFLLLFFGGERHNANDQHSGTKQTQLGDRHRNSFIFNGVTGQFMPTMELEY